MSKDYFWLKSTFDLGESYFYNNSAVDRNYLIFSFLHLYYIHINSMCLNLEKLFKKSKTNILGN